MRRTDAATTAVVRSRGEFVDLYERSMTDVYSYLASRVGDRGVVEELTQDVFVAGAHRCAAGEVVDVAWLIAVARYKLIDHWRAQARNDRKLALAHSAALTRPSEEPESIDPTVATRVLAELNPVYRAALVLRHVDGLTVAVVAAHLGRSVEATEQVLTRARTSFRARYEALSDE